MSLPSEVQSLWANQISSTYLNWWPRYNYFRFWKTKRLPYWKSTFGFDFDHLPEICTLFCIRLPNLSKSKHPVWKYDVISISQDGGRDGWILLPDSYLLMSLPSEGQSLLANQILSRYLKWRLRYIFYDNPKWLGRGQIFFQNQECVNILVCSVTFYEFKNVFLMLADNVCTIQALFVTKPLH